MNTEFDSHYPDFNVLLHRNHWDEHTRQIVEKRLQPEPPKKLKPDESVLLTHLSRHLLADDREEVLRYVIHHIDSKLSSDIGESQRKADAPKFSALLSTGLEALDHISKSLYGNTFVHLSEPEQANLVQTLMDGDIIQVGEDGVRPTKEFLHRILTEVVSAYYSHPYIWSEIGYAGPAYPRGYVRSERGLTDPWEANASDAK